MSGCWPTASATGCPETELNSSPLFRPLAAAVLGLLGLTVGFAAHAQRSEPNSKGIYTCIDSKGRRLTSDRPIPECLDREQRELTRSGTVKRVVPPSYTAEERAELEALRKAEEAERSRANEERRRERALLIRYPNQATHDKARADAMAQIDEVILAVKKRLDELNQQRTELDQELEFYKSDVKKAPAWLQRKHEDNLSQIQIQTRFLSDQDQEKLRVNVRFDEEKVTLQRLWGKR